MKAINLRVGTASGIVISSLDDDDPPTPLTDYTVSLYRLSNINDPVGQFFAERLRGDQLTDGVALAAVCVLARRVRL